MASDYVRVHEYGETYLVRRRYADAAKIVDDDPTPTIEELCGILDDEAESENYHSLVGVADTMVEDLRAAGADEEVIRTFLAKVLERGGLVR